MPGHHQPCAQAGASVPQPPQAAARASGSLSSFARQSKLPASSPDMQVAAGVHAQHERGCSAGASVSFHEAIERDIATEAEVAVRLDAAAPAPVQRSHALPPCATVSPPTMRTRSQSRCGSVAGGGGAGGGPGGSVASLEAAGLTAQELDEDAEAAASLRKQKVAAVERAQALQHQFEMRLPESEDDGVAARGGRYVSQEMLALALRDVEAIRESLRTRMQKGSTKKRKGSVQRAYSELRVAERARRSEQLVRDLLQDESEYGMHFDSDEDASKAALDFVIALDETNADGTIKLEASNMKAWVAFCDRHMTAVVRRRRWTEGSAEHNNEKFVVASAFLFIYSRMQPRPGSKHPPRPSSAVNVLRGIKRFHLRLGLQFPDLSEVVKLANGLTRAYVQKNCPDGLLPKRAEPILPAEIAGIRELGEGTPLSTWQFAARSLQGISFRAAVETLAQTGFRGAEVALATGNVFGRSCINRSSIIWRIGGRDVTDPSDEQLDNLGPGDFVLIIPPPSKCDQFGVAWGNSPIYLRWTHGKGAAYWLQQLEQAWRVRGDDSRANTPLFVDDAKKPLTRRWLNDAVKAALRATGATPERVQQLTLHSFRRFLACALLAANVSEHQICALLRWRSTKSLAAYAALNAKAYSSMIEATERAQVDSIRTANLRRHVVTDVEDVVRNLMGDNQALAAAAAPDGRDLLECDEDDLFGDD